MRSKANTSQLNIPHTRISHTGYVLWADVTRRTRIIGYLHYSFPINGVWPNHLHVYIYTHTHPFNGPFSGTTHVSRYQKGRTNLDFTEARDSVWQWHQLSQMQVCTLLQTDNHISIPPLSFFTGRMPFLPTNQQLQSTEGNFMFIFKLTLNFS